MYKVTLIQLTSYAKLQKLHKFTPPNQSFTYDFNFNSSNHQIVFNYDHKPKNSNENKSGQYSVNIGIYLIKVCNKFKNFRSSLFPFIEKEVIVIT